MASSDCDQLLATYQAEQAQVDAGLQQVAELFAEAASLDARRQLLQAEEDQLTSGVGDPTHLQPSIDALNAQKASTQALLQEATDLRAAISADLEATAARRQEVKAEVNDANRRATAAREAYENCASGGLQQPDPTGDELPQTDPEQDAPEGTEPAPDDTGAGDEAVSG